MRPPTTVVAVLAALVVLAGCSAPAIPERTPSDSTPSDATPRTAVERSPIATPTAVDAAQNPWGDTVVVAVDNRGDPGRDFAPLVRNATAYWERHAERYAGYEIDYRVEPNASDPDVVATFVDSVPECGHVGDAAGCAPLVTDARQIDRPVRVWVQTGLSAESTVLILKHEFGHTLGLSHDDPPADVMRASSVLYTQPQPDATERDLPWADADFTVRVDVDGADDPDVARDQIGHALDYYEDDPPGVPPNVSFTVTDDDAEIVVSVANAGACGGTGSCIRTRGTDPDGDGAIEEYTRAEIVVVGVDTDAVGWHVGYWLAYALGAEADAEKPPPFRDASYRERRSEWWA